VYLALLVHQDLKDRQGLKDYKVPKESKVNKG
jgi:hypothetical protein